jgi:hypothetical protein
MSFDIPKVLDYSVFSLRQQSDATKAGTALSSATINNSEGPAGILQRQTVVLLCYVTY